MRVGGLEARNSDSSLPERTRVTDKVLGVVHSLGEMVLDHLAGVTAGYKLSTGSDAQSPFTAREQRVLQQFGHQTDRDTPSVPVE